MRRRRSRRVTLEHRERALEEPGARFPVFARASYGAYCTIADSTCFPRGASVRSCTVGIVISSAGSGEHSPYFDASNACSR